MGYAISDRCFKPLPKEAKREIFLHKSWFAIQFQTCFKLKVEKSNWISLVFWATELDTTLSSSICQPASINKSTSGNRARYGFIEVDISTGLDELIDLGKPSSICRYRARIVEDGEARTLTFPGGQVECYRAR